MLERLLSLRVALVILAVCGGLAQARAEADMAMAAPQSEMTIRKTVREVRIAFHLSARNGRPVPNLQPAQFSIYQDGKPIPQVTGFYAEENLPLQLLLMVDASGSMGKELAAEQAAAGAFLSRVVRPEMDETALLAFAARVEVEASSPDAFRRIAELHSAGQTSLFDAICRAAELLPRRQGRLTRRVLVLLSDGDDTYSRHSLADAVAAAQRSDLVIYAVTEHDPKELHWGDANLVKLTGETGGRVFFLKNYKQSDKVFAEIEQEIRSQYSATFRPAGDACGFHQVRIEPVDRSLRVRSRAGFYSDCF